MADDETSGDPEPRPDEMSEEAVVADPDDGHGDPADPNEDDSALFEEAVRPWRAAEALKQLRKQVDAAFPSRKKGNDGTVGDAAHQARTSDHNPWIVEAGKGVVSAMDITHDPASGCDCNLVVEALRASRDPRIKYLIWNRRIASASAIGSVPAWTWRRYTGSNPHDHHFHVSVKPEKARYDSTAEWTIRSTTESLGEEAVDPETDIANALATVGANADPFLPLRPQLLAAQATVGRLIEELDGIEADTGSIEESVGLERPGRDITARIAIELIAHEGIVREAYLDSRKVWTWSVGLAETGGFNVKQYKDNPASLEACLEAYLKALRTRYLPAVLKAFPEDLTENQLGALLSFHYNTGSVHRLKPNGMNFMLWRKPPEIRERRQREQDLYSKGKWTGDGKALVYEVAKPSYHPARGKRQDVAAIIQKLMA